MLDTNTTTRPSSSSSHANPNPVVMSSRLSWSSGKYKPTNFLIFIFLLIATCQNLSRINQSLDQVNLPGMDVKDHSTKDNDTEKQKQQLNIIILFPDDWRHNSIGKENPIIQTPFLDSLADEGIRFRQNAVTTAICWCSRATLFSGQWVSRHQSYKLFCPNFGREESWNHSWPKLLQNDGYFVGHVGKWQYHGHNDADGRFDWAKYGERDEKIDQNNAIDFLQKRPKDKPFAMTVAFKTPKAGNGPEPGAPWSPKKETRAIYENVTIPEPYNMTHARSLLPYFIQEKKTEAIKRFHDRFGTPFHYQEGMKNMYALITQVDMACKKIVDEVKRQGLYNNTMIIFSTDHGMFHGSHGLAGKWYPYQESIRSPLIIYDPRMPADKVGTIDDNFTLNVDLAETILGAAGLKPHERMQGRDISDLYLQNKLVDTGRTALETIPWREEFYYEFSIPSYETAIPSSNALVRKKWKFIDFYDFKYELLFNLEEDPMELTDVKDRTENAEILSEMRQTLAMYKGKLSEPKEKTLRCEKHNDSYWLSKNPTND